MIHCRATLQGLCKNEVDNHGHFEKRLFLQYHWYYPVCKYKADNYQTTPEEILTHIKTNKNEKKEEKCFQRGSKTYYSNNNKPIIPKWPDTIKYRTELEWKNWWRILQKINNKKPGGVDFLHRLSLRNY